mgnify:CR=1 FL=1
MTLSVAPPSPSHSSAMVSARSQTEAMSGTYGRMLAYLEKHADLDRQVEFLPNAEELAKREFSSYVSPELAVLLATAKLALQDAIEKTDLADDEALTPLLRAMTRFPAPTFAAVQGEVPLLGWLRLKGRESLMSLFDQSLVARRQHAARAGCIERPALRLGPGDLGRRRAQQHRAALGHGRLPRARAEHGMGHRTQ